MSIKYGVIGHKKRVRMKQTTNLLTLYFCFILISCGQKGEHFCDKRSKIDFREVNKIEIKNNPLGRNKLPAEIKQLTTEQSKLFVEKWNKSESVGLCKYLLQYSIYVTFKDGSKRTFRINGRIIKENNDYGYSIEDEKFFDNLWRQSNSATVRLYRVRR
jgi:hypothetical protein